MKRDIVHRRSNEPAPDPALLPSLAGQSPMSASNWSPRKVYGAAGRKKAPSHSLHGRPHPETKHAGPASNKHPETNVPGPPSPHSTARTTARTNTVTSSFFHPSASPFGTARYHTGQDGIPLGGDFIHWAMCGGKEPALLKKPMEHHDEEVRHQHHCLHCPACLEKLHAEEEAKKPKPKSRKSVVKHRWHNANLGALKRNDQLRGLRTAIEDNEHSKLKTAVSDWEYEDHNVDFQHASKLLQQHEENAADTTENEPQQAECQCQRLIEPILAGWPVDLTALRQAAMACQNSHGLDSCSHLTKALNILDQYEHQVSSAVLATDGWALCRLWGDFCGALEDRSLARQAVRIRDKHARVTEDLLANVTQAPLLEDTASAGIQRAIDAWEFAKNDPALDVARFWLWFHNSIGERCSSHLRSAAQVSSDQVLSHALQTWQAICPKALEMTTVQEAFDLCRYAYRVAGAASFGVPVVKVPPPDHSYDDLDAHMVELVSVLDSITMDAIIDMRILPVSPPGFLEIVAVIMCLLSGIGLVPASVLRNPKDNSLDLKAAKHLLYDSELMQHLRTFVTMMQLHCRHGIGTAREEFRIYHAAMPAVWSAQGMAQIDPLAGNFFKFVQIVFAYDLLLHDWHTHAIVVPKEEELRPADVEIVVQEHRAGMLGKPSVAAPWVVCNGKPEEVERNLEVTQKYAEVLQQRLTVLTNSLSKPEAFGDGAKSRGEQPPPLQPGGRMLRIVVQSISGQMLADMQVSDAATGAQLKQLVADANGPDFSAQCELLFDGRRIRDESSLADQQMARGPVAAVMLVRAVVLLSKRLQASSQATRTLSFDTSEIQSSGVAIEAAASLCGLSDSVRDKRLGQEELRVVLNAMSGMLFDAYIVVNEAAKGRRPSTAQLCFHGKVQAPQPHCLDVPMYNISEALHLLDVMPNTSLKTGDSRLIELIREFVRVMRDFYVDFVPTYIYWGITDAAYAHATLALQHAHAAASLIGSLGLRPMLRQEEDAMQPSSLPNAIPLELNTATAKGQVEELAMGDISLAMPHIARARLLSNHRIRVLTGSSSPRTPCEKLHFTADILQAYFGPLLYFEAALNKIADGLDVEEFAKMFDYSIISNADDNIQPPPLEVFRLFVAVFWMLQKNCVHELEITELQRRLHTPQQFKASLLNWSPLTDGSVSHLKHARALLLRLWGCFGAGCIERHALQQLYAWAVLASLLAPLLIAAQELRSTWERVLAMVPTSREADTPDREERGSTDENEKLWADLRWMLYRSEEPWWWLRLIGCARPEEVYNVHGFAPDFDNNKEGEKAADEELEREAKEKYEAEMRELQEREARERLEREARELRERQEREQREQREEWERREKEAMEQREREARRLSQMQADERREKEAREQHEREEREKQERDRHEKEMRERHEREAREQQEKEAREQEARELREKEEFARRRQEEEARRQLEEEEQRKRAEEEQAARLAQRQGAAVDDIERLLKEDPINLTRLRAAVVVAMPLFQDPDDCPPLKKAVAVLTEYEKALRAAVAASDGWKVRQLWGDYHGALPDSAADLADKASSLRDQHVEVTEELQRALESGSHLESSARETVEKCCSEWAFDSSDPFLGAARGWLQLQTGMAMLHLPDRRQAPPPSCRAAGAVTFGVPMAEVPPPFDQQETLEEEARAALDVLGAIRHEDLMDLAMLPKPPTGVLEIVAVAMCLLSGTGIYDLPPSGSPTDSLDLNAARRLLYDDSVLKSLENFIPWLGSGCRVGVVAARQAYTEYEGSMPEVWSVEKMTQQSAAAGALFQFVERVFEYDGALQLKPLYEVVSPEGQRDGWPLSEEEQDGVMKALRSGILYSPSLCTPWVICGGDAKEVDRETQLVRSQLHGAKCRVDVYRQAFANAAAAQVPGTDVRNPAHHPPEAGRNDTADTLTLTVHRLSGQAVAGIVVSSVATGAQLKEAIQKEIGSLDSSPLCLLFEGQNIADNETLARQGVTSGAALVLVQMSMHLQVQLQHCSDELASCVVPSARCPDLLAAGILCGVPGTLTSSGRLIDAPTESVLTAMRGLISEASDVVLAASRGERPHVSQITYCTQWQERASPSSLEIPMCNICLATRVLSDDLSKTPVKELMILLLNVVRVYYIEFVPLYIAWGAASENFSQVKVAVHDAEESSALVRELGLRPMLSNTPEAFWKDGQQAVSITLCTERGEGQVQAIGARGLSVAAPHVERASRAVHRHVCMMLEKPAASDPSGHICFTMALLHIQVSALLYFESALQKIADSIDYDELARAASNNGGGEAMHHQPPPPEVFRLFAAVLGILQSDCAGDVQNEEVRKHLADSRSLKGSMTAWSPLRQASVEQLRHARAQLLHLWAYFGAGCPARSALQALYAWAVLATALERLLPTARQLAPAREAALASWCLDGFETGGAKTKAEKERAAWDGLRRTLQQPADGNEDPWWWLRLVGADDPQEMYFRHGYHPDEIMILEKEEGVPEKAMKPPAPPESTDREVCIIEEIVPKAASIDAEVVEVKVRELEIEAPSQQAKKILKEQKEQPKHKFEEPLKVTKAPQYPRWWYLFLITGFFFCLVASIAWLALAAQWHCFPFSS